MHLMPIYCCCLLDAEPVQRRRSPRGGTVEFGERGGQGIGMENIVKSWLVGSYCIGQMGFLASGWVDEEMEWQLTMDYDEVRMMASAEGDGNETKVV